MRIDSGRAGDGDVVTLVDFFVCFDEIDTRNHFESN